MSDVDKLVAAILAIGEQDAKLTAKYGEELAARSRSDLTALRHSIREAQDLITSLWAAVET